MYLLKIIDVNINANCTSDINKSILPNCDNLYSLDNWLNTINAIINTRIVSNLSKNINKSPLAECCIKSLE
ncbi:hypothetical protein LDI01_26580 [Lentilactobacillus diolivorans]|uniref:Uncharacterized protein n=1 Tax=Lentilactobacillus diolivorans TaxID=179838 RepID=A0ABQ0XNQ9_9LACO|nr:hypothetical protein LDI01_26580 [Lentilactobacillus diolivorans]